MADEYKYLLTMPQPMVTDVTRAAHARGEFMSVWIREAIRQRLDREAKSNGDD
jgi:hypothetical protein